jgi:hypothetical protein
MVKQAKKNIRIRKWSDLHLHRRTQSKTDKLWIYKTKILHQPIITTIQNHQRTTRISSYIIYQNPSTITPPKNWNRRWARILHQLRLCQCHEDVQTEDHALPKCQLTHHIRTSLDLANFNYSLKNAIETTDNKKLAKLCNLCLKYFKDHLISRSEQSIEEENISLDIFTSYHVCI